MIEIKEIEQFIANLTDGDDACKYCIHQDECPRGVKYYGGSPIYPPCADSYAKEYIDYDLVGEYLEELEELEEEEKLKTQIARVIFSNPATIILWKDGTKTVVKVYNEKFDKEKGFAMAIVKKALGNKSNYYQVMKKYLSSEVE